MRKIASILTAAENILLIFLVIRAAGERFCQVVAVKLMEISILISVVHGITAVRFTNIVFPVVLILSILFQAILCIFRIQHRC